MEWGRYTDAVGIVENKTPYLVGDRERERRGLIPASIVGFPEVESVSLIGATLRGFHGANPVHELLLIENALNVLLMGIAGIRMNVIRRLRLKRVIRKNGLRGGDGEACANGLKSLGHLVDGHDWYSFSFLLKSLV